MFVGMWAGNPAMTIILRATVLMIMAWIIGCAVGGLAQRTAEEHIEQHKLDHPIPSDFGDDESHRDAELLGGNNNEEEIIVPATRPDTPLT